MEYLTCRPSILCLLGLCILLFKTELTEAQGKRASRVTSSRSFGTNVKPTSSNGLSFDCPEEFGYYPHPSDCTQYYVCVFGGALLESCTGGLMYSHELQTCDWPRNVGCELVDTSSERDPARSQIESQSQTHTQAQQQQHVPSRVRFGAAFGSQGGTQKAPTVAPQYHRSPPQVIQAQVQHVPPPPPALRVPPNPVITSRGQPKPLIDSQEEIAKLYAEAQETLPPVEEEESDRQQRVYRGQPSTVSQVQRDRDGIIHQASINAIPQAGKIGSYAFGTAYSESLDDDQTLEYELSHNRLDEDRRRKRRDLSAQVSENPPKEPSEPENPTDSITSSEVAEPDSFGTLSVSSETSNSSNNSKERSDEAAQAISKPRKYSSKISQPKGETAMEFAYEQAADEDGEPVDGYGDEGDVAMGESKRRSRQLRPIQQALSKWPGPNYRAIDAPSPPQYSQQTGYSFGSYNPYLTPPNPAHAHPHGSHNYNQLSPGYQVYQHQQQQQQLAPAGSLPQQKPKVVYTGYNLSLPPPPLEDDFRPIAGSYYGAAGTGLSNQRPPNNQQQHSSAGDLLPYLIQQLKELKERRKHLQAENFAYFHLDNQPESPAPASGTTFVPTAGTTPHTPFAYYSPVDPSKPAHQVTPNGQYSTMGGFYNNQKPDHAPYTANYPGKVVSQYSIGSAEGQRSTTESNYFQYNIVANQKMKGIFSTATPNQIGHAATKVRPPVTPLQVTQSINVVSAPNLAYNRPNSLQQVPFRDFSHLPVGISYASNNTMPESYQTFTKSISTTEPPLRDVTTTTPKSKPTNFQFNIHEFMANLKASDLASVNPSVNPLMKYFKQVSSIGNGNVNGHLRNTVLRRPVTTSTSSTSSSITTTQIPTTSSPPTPKTRLRAKPTVPTPVTPSTTRALKGYENFIKGIQNQINNQASSQSPVSSTSTSTLRVPTTTTVESIDYYDEDYEEEEDKDILPPSQMPPYMPMSETMAPPRPQMGAAIPVSESPTRGRPNFQTGFLEATTTRRPFPNFSQLNQPSAEAGVPSFLSFPSDIFQELKQRLPQLSESNTSHTSNSTRVPTTPSILRPTYNPSTISSSTVQPTTRVRYTTRPRTRGQQKWMTMSSVQGQPNTRNLTDNGPVVLDSSKQSNLGGLQLNSIHVGSGADRHRDIEYQQQQEQQQPVAPQYQPTVRQQQPLSTYRPLELSATPTPPQKTSYGNQPTLTYSSDYDEDINAQIEQENVYDQSTRSPQRLEQVAIQRLESRPTPSSAPSTTTSVLPPDARTYYDTLTTPDPPKLGPADYSYSSSAEYAYGSVEDYDQNQRILTGAKSKTQADTDDYDLIANVVAPTGKTTIAPLKRSQNTISTPPPSRRPTKSYTTTTQTVKVTKTTTTPFSPPTTKLASSKAHANKQHVPNKSKTTSTKAYSTPNTTTPPTNPSTYSSNPFLKSKLQSLAQSLASFVSHSLSRPNNTDYRHVQNLTNPHRQSTIPEQIPNQVPAQTSSPIPPPSTTQWPLVKDSSGSNQQDPVETVFDESQNIHVQTAEPPKSRSFETSTSSKFLDFINAAAYGTSPRGNLLNSVNSDIPYRERGYSLESNSKEPEPQRKRIQTYITSDVEPHSFRIPANGGVISPPEEIDTASTTRPNKPIQYSLQSGSHGFSLRVEQNQSEGNASEPIFSEKKSLPLSTSTSTSTTTELSEDLADIIPTTYAPPLRIWRNGRPTIQQTYYRPTTASATTTTSTSSSTSASTTSNDNVGSSSTLRTTTTQKALAPPSTERYIVPGVGYTARANYFKDSLNRVTANPAARFVSPYKSLENLLQEDRQHQHHQLRTTARPRLTNAPVFPPFLQTTSKPPKNLFITTSARNTSQDVLATMATGNARNFSVSDAILSTFSPQRPAPSMLRTTTTTTTTTSTEPPPPEVTSTITAAPTTTSAVIVSSPIRLSQSPMRPRGRSRYTAATLNSLGDSVDEPTTYAPKFRLPAGYDSSPYPKRKPQRVRVFNNQRISFGEPTVKPQEKYEAYKAALQAKDSADGAQSVLSKSLKRKPIDNEASILDEPRAEALVSQPLPSKLQNSIEELSTAIAFSSTEHVVAITDRPTVKFLYSNKYRQQTAERTLAESLQNAGYITSANGRAQKFRSANVLEQLRQFLAGSDSTSNSDESGTSQFVDEYSLPEIKAAVNEVKHLYLPKDPTATTTVKTSTTTPRPTTTPMAPLITTRPTAASVNASERQVAYHAKPYSIASTFSAWSTEPPPTARTTPSSPDVSTARSPKVSPTPAPAPAPTIATATPSPFTPPTARASRVNNVIKSSIAAAAHGSSPSTYQPPVSAGKVQKLPFGFAPNNKNHQHQTSTSNHNGAAASASVKCSDSTLNAKCNEIPSRNSNRNRGSAIYANQDRDVLSTPNRGTHPPRTRPTLKPSGTIVSKAQEFVDIYRYPPSRPDPIYPQPTPDKTAAKCRKDVCLLPDCYCGGKEIPGDLQVESIPQIVLLTFDDSVNDLNKQLYTDLFEKGRVNPNGCPITATFYVSHEWTDYSQVQNLYADGHEMASHTVSHSFGEQFSQKKWTREIAGQREILAAYGGVKLSDVRGMRAPFLSVGGNKMYKMLYDSNFTYDSSMPVYENRPPSWPYTLDYKIFHDCMIPPCPTRSYPGVWQVPMVMWQDLNGGRCSMGDACSNPSDADGVTKMIMKNFERHYTTNRAPFGLFYHAAWFTQPHHKEGFIKFLDAINAMQDVWIITNWQALQWVRDPTPTSRINSFQPFQCDYSDRPKRCNNPKVCNLWHKSGVRYMKTCQPCPDIYPWTGKSGIRSSRIDNEVEEPAA
uniref:Mucin-5AC isoform X2 n=1 Tax=Drosophila rhopaloa TaxID=1041015 RepID=A0A6P4F1X5_DRORH